MGIRAIWAQYGRPAATLLRTELAAVKGDDPLAPVTVLVASNGVGVATRRLLASGEMGGIGPGPGLIGVDFMTLYRLAELIGAPLLAVRNRVPVSTPVLTAAVRGALSAHPGVFGPVANHPTTEEALVGIYRELRDLPEQSLEGLAAAGRRPADVVRLFRAARATVVRLWYDEEDLITSAIDALAEQSHRPDPAILYLPQRISLHMARLVRAVAVTGDVTVIAGSTGDETADADVADAIRLLGIDGPSPPPTKSPYAPGRTRIVTASDADDEVRAAMRAVVEAIRSGTRPERIAVLYPSSEPYSRLVHEHLHAAGVRANGAAVIPLRERVAPRILLHLLSLPETGFGRGEVMAWVSSAPVVDGGGPAPVSTWEGISRDAGVIRGRDQWEHRLADYAQTCRDRGAQERPDLDESQREARRVRYERRSGQAMQLRRFVLEVIDELERVAAQPAKWSGWALWAKDVLRRYTGSDEVMADRWPQIERKAVESLERAIDRLEALDLVEGPVGLDVFQRTLELELDADLGRFGRAGEGVTVGPVSMGVGLDLDTVILLGLAEGSFPSRVRDDSVLSDQDRSSVTDLPLRRERVGRQHRALLAAASSASRQVLCRPRGDLRATTERTPSRWLLDAAEAISGRRVAASELGSLGPDVISVVPSFAAGVRREPFPPTGQERRLRELMEGCDLTDTRYRAGREVVRARRSRDFTRFDGNLAGVDVAPIAETVVSATRLESWVACPHAYFMRHVLGVHEIEEREDELRITALDKGSLYHEVLDRFVSTSGFDWRPWDSADRAEMAKIAADVCAEFEARGLTGRQPYWSADRRQILADLDRFLTEDCSHGTGVTRRPVAVELPFEQVVLSIGGDRRVMFQGRIDRIDADDQGRLHVLDYKTGRSDVYRRIEASDPSGGGKHLQLVVYAVAAEAWGRETGAGTGPVTAQYWMVSQRGGWGRYGYEVEEEIVARTGDTVGRVVEGIESGVFPPHPTRASTSPWRNCAYCDIDGLGEVDLQRAWGRKRDDPALSIYRDLAEPADAS